MALLPNDEEIDYIETVWSFQFESDDAQASDEVHDMFIKADEQRRNEGPSYVYKPFEISAPSVQRVVRTYVDWVSRSMADQHQYVDEDGILDLLRNEYGFFFPRPTESQKRDPETMKSCIESLRGLWYYRLYNLTVIAREITGLDISLPQAIYTFCVGENFKKKLLPDTTKEYDSYTKDVSINLGEFRSLVCSHIDKLDLENLSVKRVISYLPLFIGVNRDPSNILSFFLMAHRRFRCFDVYPFLLSEDGGYPGDLLVRLIWPRRYITSEHALGRLVLQFSDKARSYLTLFMLQCVAMVCTTFIMLPPIGVNKGDQVENRIGLEDVDECLRLYPSHVWNTGHMPDQVSGEQMDLLDGFKLVNECMKVGLDEIDHDISYYRNRFKLPRDVVNTVNEVSRYTHRLLIAIISEMLGYLFCRIYDKPSAMEFVVLVEHHARRFYETFRTRSYMNDDWDHFPMAEVVSVVEQISNGAPTMGAEISFSPRTFKQKIDINPYFPRDVVHWDREQVSRRARWNDEHQNITENFSLRSQEVWNDNTPILFLDEEVNQRVEVRDVPLPEFKRYSIHKNWFTDMSNRKGTRALPQLPVPPGARSITQQINQTVQTPAGSSSAHTQQQIENAQNQFTDPVVMANRQFWPDVYYQRNIPIDFRDNIPRELVRFEEDDAGSDQEYEMFPAEDRTGNTNYNQEYPEHNIGEILEDLYAEILTWVIHPQDYRDNGHINSSVQANTHWLKWFFRANPKSFLISVTYARNAKDYMEHMRCYVIMSIRAQTRQTLQQSYPLRNMSRDADEFLRQLKHEQEPYPEFHRVLVRKVSASRKIYHIETRSNDPDLARTLALNLRGITLCIGFLRAAPEGSRSTRRGDTKLFFVIIRSAHFDGQNLDTLGLDGDLESVTLRICISKDVLRSENFLPEEDQSLHFHLLEGISSQVRIYRSIYHVPDLPESFRNFMFGNNNVKMYYESKNVLQPVSRSTLTPEMAMAPLPQTNNRIRQMIEDQVDPSSLRYIQTCLHDETCTVDRCHFMCLVQSLRIIGRGEPGTSGLGLIQGPPGTGKTNNIIYLLGALLHHSTYGHVNREQINYRNVEDRTLRAARDHRAFKILVVASTNNAVDNILERLHGGGIPVGDNQSIYPSMLRIARYDYEPKEHLRQYMVREASTLYDDNHDERNNPSIRARRRRAEECIIFLSTNVCSAGTSLRELNQSFDVVIHDEGAYSSELETLCPLTATATKNGNNRLFYFGFGDEKQLPQLNLIKQMLISSNVVGLCPFNADTLASSFFERMIGTARCTHVFMDTQYRMHPSISKVVSLPFYSCYFKCPRPIEFFLVAYNQPSVDIRGFYPMSFIDTSSLAERKETVQGNGRYINEVESGIIVSILNRLFDIVGDEGLDNQIAVIAPYKSQVEHLRQSIRASVRACNTQIRFALRNIQICTVDAMQGSQRDVVIFSTTRSNDKSRVGFTQDSRRLNVSVSRARYLNIIVGDYKTINTVGSRTGNRTGIRELEQIYHMCARNEQPSARLAKAISVGNGEYNILYQPVLASGSRTRSNTRNPSRGVPQVHDNPPNADFAGLYPAPPPPQN